MFAIGASLVGYACTIGNIASNHSVQNYLVLCTGFLSLVLGFFAVALSSRKT
jgi:hypothetical protein